MTNGRLQTIGGYIEDFPENVLDDSPLGLIKELHAEAVQLSAFREQFYLTRNMLAAIVSTFEDTSASFPFPELFSEAKRVLKEVDGE